MDLFIHHFIRQLNTALAATSWQTFESSPHSKEIAHRWVALTQKSGVTDADIAAVCLPL